MSSPFDRGGTRGQRCSGSAPRSHTTLPRPPEPEVENGTVESIKRKIHQTMGKMILFKFLQYGGLGGASQVPQINVCGGKNGFALHFP